LIRDDFDSRVGDHSYTSWRSWTRHYLLEEGELRSLNEDEYLVLEKTVRTLISVRRRGGTSDRYARVEQKCGDAPWQKLEGNEREAVLAQIRAAV
jgi:hypothetical protein